MPRSCALLRCTARPPRSCRPRRSCSRRSRTRSVSRAARSATCTSPGRTDVRPVLMHGYPLDERMWERQLELLREHDPLAPRLYGRGPSVDAWAQQILAEVDGDLVAVGASMGGYVAFSMARQAPERVRGILLAASRALPDTPERRAARDASIEQLRAEGPPPN